MGVVYRAFDRERNEPIAIKALRQLDGEHLLRFKQEFRAVQSLQHPKLVTLGELIEAQGSWFFTMELIEGTDFQSHVSPRRQRESAGGLALDLGPGHAEEAPASFDEARLRPALMQL